MSPLIQTMIDFLVRTFTWMNISGLTDHIYGMALIGMDNLLKTHSEVVAFWVGGGLALVLKRKGKARNHPLNKLSP